MIELKERVGDHEVEIIKEYITLLEDRFAEATAKSIRQEGQIRTFQIRLESIEGRAEEAEEKATIVEGWPGRPGRGHPRWSHGRRHPRSSRMR